MDWTSPSTFGLDQAAPQDQQATDPASLYLSFLRMGGAGGGQPQPASSAPQPGQQQMPTSMPVNYMAPAMAAMGAGKTAGLLPGSPAFTMGKLQQGMQQAQQMMPQKGGGGGGGGGGGIGSILSLLQMFG